MNFPKLLSRCTDAPMHRFTAFLTPGRCWIFQEADRLRYDAAPASGQWKVDQVDEVDEVDDCKKKRKETPKPFEDLKSTRKDEKHPFMISYDSMSVAVWQVKLARESK